MLLAEDYPLKRRDAGEERMRKKEKGGEVVRMVGVIAKETESQVEKCARERVNDKIQKAEMEVQRQSKRGRER